MYRVLFIIALCFGEGLDTLCVSTLDLDECRVMSGFCSALRSFRAGTARNFATVLDSTRPDADAVSSVRNRRMVALPKIEEKTGFKMKTRTIVVGLKKKARRYVEDRKPKEWKERRRPKKLYRR